jgi:hypothetical protein
VLASRASSPHQFEEVMSKAKKAARREFNEACLARDGRACVACGRSVALNVHHITDRREMPNGGYVPENGITLCEWCHKKAERFHASGGSDFVEGFHPRGLYGRIGSSFQKAYAASSRLGGCDGRVMLCGLGGFGQSSHEPGPENYPLLLGRGGVVLEDHPPSDELRDRVLVKFDDDLARLGLACHNHVPNALWILPSDLAFPQLAFYKK